MLFSTVTGCGAQVDERRSADPLVSSQEQPAQESWDITIVISDSGHRKTLIKAGHTAEYRKGDKTEIHADGDVSVLIINPNGSKTIITAGRGIVHDNQDIEAFDHVVIRSDDGTVLRTEYIKRSARNHIIRTDKYVTITSPTRTIRGYGFESDDAMKRYRIFHASGEALSQ
ncbi:MAG TPA: LPS export ABC transporter periplasmic protein LptC [Chlorobaculum parvum]|uniref:LPS export ABC transporter periplasmic protein LptC n=1 Tax=Chlorobaculum parvum TaxID=274539 RepID=A0A7C5DIT0_9CHLB|nr:LPS export ABC transporter periplasmic protein LptC [Chlorobaculum parvum]